MAARSDTLTPEAARAQAFEYGHVMHDWRPLDQPRDRHSVCARCGLRVVDRGGTVSGTAHLQPCDGRRG